MVEYKIGGALLFQPSNFRFFYEDKEISLNQKETEVLQLLCKHQQQVVERARFMQEVWGDKEGADISLNKSILSLRRKFESLGYLDAIKTVPRVGYMLRLDTLSIEVVATEPQMVNELLETTQNMRAEEKALSSRFNHRLPYLLLIGAVLLLVLLYALYMKKETSPLSYKMAYKSPSLTVLEMADVTQYINYPSFTSRLPSDYRMLVSISNSAVSFIGKRNDHQNWSKVFILDGNTNINTQLTCIASYIDKTSTLTNSDVLPTSINSEQGLVFHKKRFYSPCLNIQPDYIGEIAINSTHYPTDDPKYREPSSLIQNVFFYDNDKKPVFHFTSVSRVIHLYEGKSELDFFVHFQIKSLKIDTIDQQKIDNNKYINMVFNEYESDNIFLKSITSSNSNSNSNSNSVTTISSVFDGTLSESIRLEK